MKDIALVNDPTAADNHDLLIENYDLQFVDQLDAVQQNLTIRMQFFWSEWFLDTGAGIKFYDFVFIKNPDMTTISSIMKATILETPNVNEIIEYSQDYNAEQRKLVITYKVNTTFGLLTDTVPVGA